MRIAALTTLSIAGFACFALTAAPLDAASGQTIVRPASLPFVVLALL